MHLLFDRAEFVPIIVEDNHDRILHRHGQESLRKQETYLVATRWNGWRPGGTILQSDLFKMYNVKL